MYASIVKYWLRSAWMTSLSAQLCVSPEVDVACQSLMGNYLLHRRESLPGMERRRYRKLKHPKPSIQTALNPLSRQCQASWLSSRPLSLRQAAILRIAVTSRPSANLKVVQAIIFCIRSFDGDNLDDSSFSKVDDLLHLVLVGNCNHSLTTNGMCSLLRTLNLLFTGSPSNVYFIHNEIVIVDNHDWFEMSMRARHCFQ